MTEVSSAPAAEGTSRTEPPVAAAIELGFAVLLVALAWALLQLWGLGAIPFHTKGEPREALVVWEMTHGGGWVLPQRNGTELPSKPPLFHWLAALTAKTTDQLNEWTIRFPSALGSLLGAWLVLAAGRALWGRAAGLRAALVLLTMFEWQRSATQARVDMTLTLAIATALLGFLFFLREDAAPSPRPRRAWLWLTAFYLGGAAAILGKGPVGIVLPALIAAATVVAARRFGIVRRMHLVLGAVTVAVVGGSWYVLAYQQGGRDFFYKQVLQENVFRMLGDPRLSGGHRHSVAYLIGSLALGMMPWTLVLPATWAGLWRRRREVSLLGGELYCGLWVFVVFAFYSLPASKRGVYLLALYPAAALLIGWWWELSRREPATRRGAALLLRIFGTLAAVAAASTAVGLAIDQQTHLFDQIPIWVTERDRPAVLAVIRGLRHSPFALPLLLSTGGAAMAAVVLARRRWELSLVSVLLTSALATVLVRQVVLRIVAPAQSQRALMAKAAQVVDPGHNLFLYGGIDYGAVYYADRHLPIYSGPLADESPRYLLLRKKEWERVRAAAVNRYQPMALDGETIESHNLILIERRP